MIEAILFDFNGVIIDDEPLQLKAYQQVLKPFDIDLTPEQYYASMGMDDTAFLRSTFKRANQELTVAAMTSAIEEKSEIHRGLIEQELPFFPGVKTFLKVTARRYQLCLVSMARRVEIDYVLGRSKLAPMFSAMVSGEEVKEHKPNPESFNLGLSKLNEKRRSERLLPLQPRECLVIEDAAQGIEAARGAGMRTIGVTNTIPEATLRAAGADVVTHSLADWTVDAVELVFK